MKELSREQCSHIAGGDPGMVLAGGGGGRAGGGGGGFGSVGMGGFNLGLGGFDLGSIGADIGGAAYTPTAPNGLFGMSLTETLASGAGLTALLTGISTGVGTSFSIQSAGGWSAAAAGAGSVSWAGVGTGIGSAAVGGYLLGTLLYNNSETVRDVSGWAVENVMNGNLSEQINSWISSMGRHPMDRVIP